MYPFYLGIDLHLRRSYVVLMDAQGEVVDKQRLANDQMKEYLQTQVPKESYAVLETTLDHKVVIFQLLICGILLTELYFARFFLTMNQ